MITKVIMPKIDQTMEKGKIVKWLKKEGEKVTKGEPLLEIETDKTTIEIEARDSGILKIVAHEGEETQIATTIAYIAKEGEAFPEEKTAVPKPSTAAISKESALKAPKVEEAEKEAATKIKASPLAKKIAEEKGVNLTQVTGTGPEGRITREDVLAFLASRPAVVAVEKEAEEVPVSDFQIVHMSSIRKAIARKMTDSKTHVPHFYVSTEVDMTEAVKMRENLIPTFESKTKVRLSITHLLIKAVAMALEEYPQLNSTFEVENVKLWNDINIGIAVSLEDGLIVPVFRRASKKSLLEIALETDLLVARAKEKKLREKEFSGGTFTISNMGILDVGLFIAIINVPETAILGVGKIADKPVVINGQIAVRKMMTATLSADHRVVDGVYAAKFLQKVKKLLEAPHSLTL
jgi:pyruvate dehydrogenase E2 component (dihydrolipoamide acetyltransferase)